MTFRISATLHATRDPRLFVRDHNRFVREAFRKAAEFHHKKHIPRHFEKFAGAKYGYAKRRSRVWVGIFEAIGKSPWRPGEPRKGSYQEYKDRLGLPPLVFTGASRHLATTQRQITATSTKGARLIVRLALGGASGRFRFKKGQTQLTQQQKEIAARIAEMETIAPDEQRAINRVIQEHYTLLANAPGTPYRKRVARTVSN